MFVVVEIASPCRAVRVDPEIIQQIHMIDLKGGIDDGDQRVCVVSRCDFPGLLAVDIRIRYCIVQAQVVVMPLFVQAGVPKPGRPMRSYRGDIVGVCGIHASRGIVSNQLGKCGNVPVEIA